VYSNTEKGNQQSLSYLPLGQNIVQDFNEIDRYLLDSLTCFLYLNDIEDIKKWGIEIENKTLY
jgi:hypothetical protein